MKPIEKAWLDYFEQVVPPTAGDAQVSETEQAFYAGAQAAFSAIVVASTSPGLVAGVRSLNEIYDELNEWFARYEKRIYNKALHRS